MKGAIASLEVYAHRKAGTSQGTSGAAEAEVEIRRLTLVIRAPAREEDGSGWRCGVALADLERPQELVGPDSVTALARAIRRGRDWLAELESAGWTLYRDRSGTLPLDLE